MLNTAFVARRRLLAAVLAFPLAAGLAACGSDEGFDPDALVVYNAQHDTLTKAWVEAFTAKTGIKVQIRQGPDLTLANQLVAEGADSPADVFLTENSPAMSLVENAGLFAPVDAATLAQVPAEYAPSTGNWVGIAARSTVMVYNPSLVAETDLPKSIMDLEDPKWAGKFGAAPKGADFQAVVSAMVELKGEQATASWLSALKNRGQAHANNIAAMKAVNAGTSATAIIYHYYWYGDQAKTKENSANTKLHYFGNSDPGAFVSVSGGGVLKSAKHSAQAQQFLRYLTGADGQGLLAASNAYEYCVGKGIASHAALKPLAELGAPKVDPVKLNSKKVVDLMTAAGLL